MAQNGGKPKKKKKTINAYRVYCLLQELCKASILGRASHASVAVSTQRNDCVVKFASTDCANAHTHIRDNIQTTNGSNVSI